MKSILSAAALLAALATPSFAEEATSPQTTAPAAQIIVPAVAEPSMSEMPAEAKGEAMPHSTAKSGGCSGKQTVYLTN